MSDVAAATRGLLDADIVILLTKLREPQQGGAVDTVIQRTIEFLISIPTLPLWMGLTAAMPPKWPVLRAYFGITIILSILGWTGLARVVRGKLLELRSGDFVLAARVAGATSGAVIRRHTVAVLPELPDRGISPWPCPP